jgi:hypothetical protein
MVIIFCGLDHVAGQEEILTFYSRFGPEGGAAW